MTDRKRLVEILTNKHALPSGWRETVADVDRSFFVPRRFTYGASETVDRAKNLERWSTLVYGDTVIVTQVNDGRTLPDEHELPTSSTSMPSLMLEMLDLLDVEDTHTVLEVGTGTGYNAAWLAYRLGDSNVTTVEIDSSLAARAEANLHAAGHHPTVLVGDGLAPDPDGPTKDRLICTCTVRDIPYAWIEKVPDGKIVTPFGNGFFSGSYAALTVTKGVGRGRFHGDPAFMWARQQRPGRGYLQDYLHHRDETETGVTTVSPLDVYHDADARFAIASRISGMWPMLVSADDGSEEHTLWLLADDARSWASIDYVPNADVYEVEQYGPRRFWTEVEAAYQWWDGVGRPSRDRFGITVDGAGQRIWLDTPDNVPDEGDPR
ncbi:methyltransferase domain-containing protein [Streptomyces sp. SID13666]|uniref:methyltransferase domain-containing protein n=1 Tax=Streptomyces sp. SID13666 TaxID=2706054 RepID=UPI0013BF30F9|nr:methyltransferase domain-containing protein [Streptomyces sp. SID13666]NEA59549.1 methyltransferase domain-containing protein [Streptomyces sp. SID13666]